MEHKINFDMQTQPKTNGISVIGAKQNTLTNIDVNFEYNKFTVVTGVSGSGKSSLVFDTLYAEGQRRYVETFSPYVRQFMDRMDRPQVDKIEGVPPAIAIDQTNPVRTSRSTVGTMTEINDHLKMLFAQAAVLYCEKCGKEVKEDTPEHIYASLIENCASLPENTRLYVCFTVDVPKDYPVEDVLAGLSAQGYTRAAPLKNVTKGPAVVEVVAGRFKITSDKSRIMEAIENALQTGKGHMHVRAETPEGEKLAQWKFSSQFSCAECGITYSKPHASTFSFNSPLGACETCKGFGRVIGVDFNLVVPDTTKSLKEGAIKPWTTASFEDCQKELLEYAKLEGIDINKPFRELSQKEHKFVLEGDPKWTSFRCKKWYGVKNFFDWLETKAYKMHVRVLLSRYRGYSECPTCRGSRLKSASQLWRIGSKELADKVLGGSGQTYQRFRSVGSSFSEEILQSLPGLNLQDIMLLPIERLKVFFDELRLSPELEKTCDQLLKEIRTRFSYLVEVGLGYLTLDRQSRTLSGGEVQRINLTTALGTSLVNTLFVLDEPSIGLHPQDMDRVNSVMRKLRKAGNTLVVVEHDPQVMLAADRIIDMGPGPGADGGRIVFDGTPQEIKKAKTLTGKYLSGALRINKRKRKKVNVVGDALVLLGAKEHNLKNIDIRIPLGHLVCVAGVSGSGKSTLVQDILVPALRQEKGQTTEAPGKFESLLGVDKIDDVIFVDQTPIGKTTRSNPALFVGAFDYIRALFAAAPLSQKRNYTAGTFSFNSGHGRCPTCEGSGFQHEEMQFLSDVYIKCPDCDGKRYRPSTLDVHITRMGKSLNIADVLDLTVQEALYYFSENKNIVNALTPLVKVGLNYLKLGQPVPTLSGGEAQRLKLAKYLIEAANEAGSKKHKMFVFDEPTTGLHFDDTAKLMSSLRELVDNGHSVLVVEHNLDVIDGSDWIIELGPEGGEKGGEELFAGTPDHFVIKETPTGKALASYRQALIEKDPTAYFVNAPTEETEIAEQYPKDAISIVNAREHNLKNLSLTIPRNKFTVVTGVSGSGKSTLAFDLVFNEGQRRYLDSLNAFARSMVAPASRPDVDAIYGIPPTVAIEQRTSRGGQKSTVATLTEIYHFLRLIYLKLGTQYCPTCHVPVRPQTKDSIIEKVISGFSGKSVMITAPLIKNRKGSYREVFEKAHNKGFERLVVDEQIVGTYPFRTLDRFKEHNIDLVVSETVISKDRERELDHVIQSALELGKGVLQVRCGGKVETFSAIRACPVCETSFPQLDPRLFSYNSAIGWCPSCQGYGLGVFQDALARENIDEEDTETLKLSNNCTECSGTRLNEVARNVLFYEKSIADISNMTVEEAEDYFTMLADAVKEDERENAIAKDAIAEILSRLAFLKEVGLSYLSLNRSAPTLSGGEAQRIRLASQLGTNLQGVCYVLDEPTIGLHPRDNKILLSALEKLADKGNSLLVVEHDEDTIRKADHVIDIGPGAGARGGQLIVNGTIDDLIANADKSLTGQYLKNPLQHKGKALLKTKSTDPFVEVKGAFRNNLKVDSVKFPLNRLTVVTGVSGSGKSTLSREVLLHNLRAAVQAKGEKVKFVGCRDLLGYEAVDRVLEVDQTPIGKTPRSCPATYVGFWDQIRKLFAASSEAKMRGYGPNRFSFNVAVGRCPDCAGQGSKTVEMNFLPDVQVPCETCGSMRFNEETLAVTWKGKNIGEVLKMDVDEAVEFFASQTSIAHPLKLMKDVGLGYLTLGQPSPTLSGGEAQRIKLVSELTKVKDDITLRGRKAPHTFYVLDEPTVGLHMADVDKLIKVLQRLVKAGNTVVVIEHNLDVMAEADWIVDLGPEGGSEGGKVVFAGPPEKLMKKDTHTAKALQEFLNR